MVFPEDWANNIRTEEEIVHYERTIIENNELIVLSMFGWGLAESESAVDDYYGQARERANQLAEERKSLGESISLEIRDGQGEVDGIEYKYMNPVVTSYLPDGEVDEVYDLLIVFIPEYRTLMHLSSNLDESAARGLSLDSASEEVDLIKGQVLNMLQTLRKE